MTFTVKGEPIRRGNDADSLDGSTRPSDGNKKQLRSRVSDDDLSEDDDAKINRAHRRIVKAWFDGKEVDMAKRDKEVIFKSDSTNENILHRTIVGLRQQKKQGAFTALPKRALDDIEALLLQRPELFTDQDDRNQTPMFEAAKLDASMLFRVINMVIPKGVLERLQKIKGRCEKGQEAECPLWDVNEKRRNQCRKNKESSTKKTTSGATTTPGALSKQENKGEVDDKRSCLHDDIDIARVLEANNKLKGILDKALKTQAHTMCLQPLLTINNFDRGQKGNTQIIPLDNFRTLLWLCPDNVFDQLPASGYTPLQLAVELYKSQSIDYDLLLSVIESLVARCPRSIFLSATVNKEKRTAYRMLKELSEAQTDQNTASRILAEELFKKTCIGFRRPIQDPDKKVVKECDIRADKKKFLYWDSKSPQQRFYLSLVGESGILDKSYIKNMEDQSGVVFETILDFVKLPYWKPAEQRLKKSLASMPGKTQDTKRDQDIAKKDAVSVDPNPYVAIFDWLWRGGVRKIFTVDVDDEGPEPHTNAAIKKAFTFKEDDKAPARDFEVEVWNWRKFDICCETVATVAPAAREVYLYSYGNTAVLRGWACDSSLSKMTQLEKLAVEIFPQNADDETDCRNYEKPFLAGIRRQCPWLPTDGISVTNHGVQANRDSHDDGKSKTVKGDGRDTKPHENVEVIPKPLEWINKLENFKSFIINLGLPNKISVKVALLDDGSKLHGLDGTQRGESFRPDSQEYFVGPCSHGTEMARCIRDVCPNAELYIARLDDSGLAENQKFTISSCHEALEWALNMDVDIISMSWTFERKDKSEDDEHEKTFNQLIERAIASKKVLLFGSLPDKSSSVQIHQVSPVGLPGVIRIGSATVYGEQSHENAYEDPNFILPGEDIPLSTGETAKGSSFATAYAAGLAAMVLYCLKALDTFVGEEYTSKALAMAQTTEGMKVIFNALSNKKSDDKSDKAPFLQPYHTFGYEFSYSEAKKIDTLREIVNEILPRQTLRAFYV